MFTGRFEDSNLLFILESLFIMSTVILLFQYDQAIAVSICSTMEIPYDLALTVTSTGFGNNIIILLLVAEIILVVLFIEKFLPKFAEWLIWR